MSLLLVNLAGFALIALIVWWFWLYQPPQTQWQGKPLVITVANGSYSPAHIQVPAGQPLTLQFIRKDPSPCAETVVFPDLQISETLPLDEAKTVRLPPLASGNYPFHCQMQMYRGQLNAS